MRQFIQQLAVRMYLVVSVSFVFCSTSTALAEVRILGSIRVLHDLDQFNTLIDGFSQSADPSKTNLRLDSIGCASVVEVPGLMLCSSKNRRAIPASLMRASFWAEGLFGNPMHHLLAQDDPKLIKFFASVGGHDLTGSDLLAFASAVSEACARDVRFCFSSEEATFFRNVVDPHRGKEQPFAIITYGLDADWAFNGSHELRHAQYFLDSCYFRVVNDFWERVMTEQDRRAVRNNLSFVYDVSNESLIRNEFQAFLLEEDRRFVSAGMIKRLKKLLLGALTVSQCPALFSEPRFGLVYDE